jgi:hypothetical protein
MIEKSMNGELIVIEDVSKKLIGKNISFMLTGSIAMNFYVEPRMTRDIDIVINLQKENSLEIVKMFEEDYYIDKLAVEMAIETNKMFNIIHNETITKVDFIIRKNIEYRLIEFERRKFINLFDIPTYIVSKEDLIISKLFWMKDSGSNMQKKDILLLLSSEYDKEYVHHWITKLGLSIHFKEIQNG